MGILNGLDHSRSLKLELLDAQTGFRRYEQIKYSLFAIIRHHEQTLLMTETRHSSSHIAIAVETCRFRHFKLARMRILANSFGEQGVCMKPAISEMN